MGVLAPGTQLKRSTFVITSELGRGGFGEVYLARQPRMGRDVAVKVLLPRVAENAEIVARFEREALAAASLLHPHVLPVFDFDFDEEAGVWFLAMQYVPGGQTLKDRIGVPMEVAETARIIAAVAAALDAAHARGIVHRDVKPANVLMDEQRPLLTDFGIAHLGSMSGMTATGMAMGTPAYMSPEQALGKPVGPKADQYSLGIMAYEMLAGRTPFVGDPLALIHQQVASAPPPLSQYNRSVTSAARAAVNLALSKDPEDRFGSCGEFAHALLAASTTAMAAAATPPSPTIAIEPSPIPIARPTPGAPSGASTSPVGRPVAAGPQPPAPLPPTLERTPLPTEQPMASASASAQPAAASLEDRTDAVAAAVSAVSPPGPAADVPPFESTSAAGIKPLESVPNFEEYFQPAARGPEPPMPVGTRSSIDALRAQRQATVYPPARIARASHPALIGAAAAAAVLVLGLIGATLAGLNPLVRIGGASGNGQDGGQTPIAATPGLQATVPPGATAGSLFDPSSLTTVIIVTNLTSTAATPVPPPTPEPARGTVRVNSVPDGAAILVDGEPALRAPRQLELVPGEHEVTLMFPTYKEWTRSITVNPGQTQAITADLDPLPATNVLTVLESRVGRDGFLDGNGIVRIGSPAQSFAVSDDVWAAVYLKPETQGVRDVPARHTFRWQRVGQPPIELTDVLQVKKEWDEAPLVSCVPALALDSRGTGTLLSGEILVENEVVARFTYRINGGNPSDAAPSRCDATAAPRTTA